MSYESIAHEAEFPIREKALSDAAEDGYRRRMFIHIVGLLTDDPTIAKHLSLKLRHMHGLDKWVVHE